jgi:hypothetical protein
VEYLSQVSNRASSVLLQAQRVEADRHAPYEYTKAAEYYRKAREEAAEASFQAAIDYGRKSEDLAQRAVAMARERAEGADRADPSRTAAPGAGEPPR